MGWFRGMFCFGKWDDVGLFPNGGKGRGDEGVVKYFKNDRKDDRKTLFDKAAIYAVRPCRVGGAAA